MRKKPKSRAGLLKSGIFAALGLLLCVYAISGFVEYRHAVSSGHPIPDSEAIISEDLQQPDETFIEETDYWVAPDMPRRIILSTLDAQGLIQRVGVTGEGRMATPTNVHVAGWSIQTVRPGEVGLSIMDGHVQGRYRPGIFRRLTELKSGARFSVEFGDGSMRDFEVVEVNTYENSEAEKRLFQKDEGIERQLTLITCAGQYDTKAGGYAERVLVVSRAVEKAK